MEGERRGIGALLFLYIEYTHILLLKIETGSHDNSVNFTLADSLFIHVFFLSVRIHFHGLAQRRVSRAAAYTGSRTTSSGWRLLICHRTEAACCCGVVCFSFCRRRCDQRPRCRGRPGFNLAIVILQWRNERLPQHADHAPTPQHLLVSLRISSSMSKDNTVSTRGTPFPMPLWLSG